MKDYTKSVISSDIEFLDIFEHMQEKLSIFEPVYNEESEIVDLTVKYVNNPIEFASKSLEEIIGRKISEIPGYEDTEAHLKIARKILPEMGNITFKHYYPSEDQYLLTSAFSTPQGFYITISRDITGERNPGENLKTSKEILGKKTENKLRQVCDHLKEHIKKQADKLKDAYNSLKESESQFRTLAENSPDLIIRINRDLNCLYVNSTVKELTGKSPEFFIGKNIDEIGLPKKHASSWEKMFLKLFETGKVIHKEHELSTVNGFRFFKTTIVPEYNLKGEIETALTLTRDITERKELEDNLKELVDELQRSNEELQQFAYVVSHDLHEPLRTITSFIQLLERRYKGQMDKDADEFIEYIVDGSFRMRQMIQDLLQYSRVTTTGGEFTKTNVKKVLEQTINDLKTMIDENHAVITHDPLPQITADEKQLQRVFQNLISNAIKFKKSDIPPKINISAFKDEEDNEYVFSISDNGIGIKKQYFDRIFNIFQRLHTKEEYEGTGIGLAVAKRIIERHGGRIWVESEPGVGSTFYFTVPISRE